MPVFRATANLAVDFPSMCNTIDLHHMLFIVDLIKHTVLANAKTPLMLKTG